MKIVVLNECFLSEDNLSTLKSIGDVEIFDDTTDEETAIKRLAGKDIALSDMFECPLNKNVFSRCPDLKFLGINSTAYEHVDLKTAHENKTVVTNVPGYGTVGVAEHVFGLLMAVNRRIVTADRSLKEKPFQINPTNKAHYTYLGSDLAGKTIGIIGLGAIGSHVAKIAQGFGMHVLAYNPSPRKLDNVKMVSLDELLKQSDIVTIHIPSTEESKNIINKAAIQKMKDGCILINTAGEACVSSSDLADALQSGKIGGAGLDGLDSWKAENPLLQAPNTIVTPRMAWFTSESLDRIGNIMTENVRNFVEGRPCNAISKAA